MTDKTQPTGAGVPAAQLDAILLAMHLRQRAKLTATGNADALSQNAANVLVAQYDRIAELKAEGSRLQNGLEAQRMLTDRAISVAKDLDAQAAAKCLHQGADAGAVAALKGLLSLVRREAPQLSGKVLGDAESAIATLQAAPPAPAAVAVSDEGAMFEAWVRTHEDAHGAFDDWSARAGWEARAALAAAPAQAGAVDYEKELTQAALRNYDLRMEKEALVAALQEQAQEHATQLAGGAVAYLDLGAGGYLDIGTDLSDEQLSKLPKGRHMLVIGGTYGVDGYAAAPGEMQKESDAAQLLKKYRKLCLEIGRGDSYHIARIDAAIAAAPAQAQEDARNLEAEALRACRDLPEGWEIVIHLEKGYGGVVLIDPEDNENDLPVDGMLFDALKESIDQAVQADAARAAQGGDKP